MEILVLGGTGAMGAPLVNLLKKEKHNTIYVTSRSLKESEGNLRYLHGNAKEELFLREILKKKFNVIIDFMIYSTEELSKRVDLLLNSADQYIFLSSSRVYAQSQTPISENSARLLDVCKDDEYLSTDEYALEKAREEDILRASGKHNYTILRPYITINDNCIKLGVYEKEHWLMRGLAGRTIVFPKDIANAKTCITYGGDVAASIIGLIHNEKAYGEAFHITNDEVYTWNQILSMYLDAIERETGKRLKVKYVPDSKGLESVWNKWQIKYDRLFDRKFDNAKIEKARGSFVYHSTVDTVDLCIKGFLDAPKYNSFNARYEAWCDRQCGEWTPLKEIPGNRTKLSYLKHRILG